MGIDDARRRADPLLQRRARHLRNPPAAPRPQGHLWLLELNGEKAGLLAWDRHDMNRAQWFDHLDRGRRAAGPTSSSPTATTPTPANGGSRASSSAEHSFTTPADFEGLRTSNQAPTCQGMRWRPTNPVTPSSARASRAAGRRPAGRGATTPHPRHAPPPGRGPRLVPRPRRREEPGGRGDLFSSPRRGEGGSAEGRDG